MRNLLLALGALLATAGPAGADGPAPAGGQGRERSVPPGEGGYVTTGRARPRPYRRVMDGPDYVGSSFGLGKPAYSGIGPRPDWGRSSVD